MISVVCVNQGNYLGRGKEYVTKLYDMIRRNTSKDFNFYCYTDDTDEYPEYIKKCKIPAGLIGWWAKLYLFSEDAGLKGRIFYFDLDTIITSGLDEIFEYSGDFMILRDFYRPHGYGSGLMAWTEGYGREIWGRYEAEGFPDIIGGDQAWIEQCVKNADIYQDKYSGIYSYKQSCEKWPPGDCRIVCFHGEPRPHQLKGSWLDYIWVVGGAQHIEELKTVMNMPQERVIKNMTANIKLELPWFAPVQPRSNNKTLCIVGGSPSIKKGKYLARLKEYKRLGARIISVNGATGFLREKGIISDAHIQFDARPDCSEFLKGVSKETLCFIGSMSDPCVFEAAKDHKVVMWHGGFDMDEQKKILEPYNETHPIVIIGGGTTVSLRAIHIGKFLGHYKFVGFGMDSSFGSAMEHHAYSQPLNDNEGYFETIVDGKTYKTSYWMYRQALNFQELYMELKKENCSIKVYGEGLIPDLCESLNNMV